MVNDYSRVAPGSIIVMHPGYHEPTFKQSVILIMEHNDGGSHGIILNRPEFEQGSIIERLKEPPKDWWTDQPFYYGGPVHPHNMFMLHTPDWRTPSTVDINGELSVSPGREVMQFMSPTAEPYRWRMLLGSSMWGPDQLEMEFRRGDEHPSLGWLVTDYPGQDWIFDQPSENLYTSALAICSREAIGQWL